MATIVSMLTSQDKDKPLVSGLSSLNITGRNEEWLVTMATIVSMLTEETSCSVWYSDFRRSVNSCNAPGSVYKYLKQESQVWIYEPLHDKTNKMMCAPSEDSDPGHLPSLIRVFPVRMKEYWAFNYLLCTHWRLWSDWVDAQSDLSLRWAHMSFCCFCRTVARVLCMISIVIL